MHPHTEEYFKISQHEVNNKEQSDFMVMVAGAFDYLCNTSMSVYGSNHDQEEARQLAGRIRENALCALPQLLEQFEQNATRNGINVLWAKDAEEACHLVKDIVERHDVKIITKGKSMISEEINLNHYLAEETGVKIFEGDLGEFIVQLRGTAPVHIVGPAINLSVREISEILGEHIGMPYTENAAEIAAFVRTYLRKQFEGADMGITGVNQAVASTGSLLLVENEGNIRWSTSSPQVHVALMSIEKVTGSLPDALYLLELLTRNCTGQAITSYVSILNGPRKENEFDGPEAMYVIIIDNGRSKAYQDPQFREALRCIRCGRCGNKCPIYLRIGAYPYGWCYPGSMGQVLMPLLLGLNKTKDLYTSCTFCGACQHICPARVPHLDIFAKYRQMKALGNEDFSANQTSWSEKLGFKTWAWGVMHPAIYRSGLNAAHKYMRLSAKDGVITHLPGPMRAWFTCRDLPSPPQEGSFHKQWPNLKNVDQKSAHDSLITNKNDPFNKKGGE